MLEHLIVDQGQYEEEIERLQKAYRPADMIEYQELVAENERLEAVVDAARHLLAGGDKEAVYHLEKALAALEGGDVYG
jgi:hypothetical protein